MHDFFEKNMLCVTKPRFYIILSLHKIFNLDSDIMQSLPS